MSTRRNRTRAEHHASKAERAESQAVANPTWSAGKLYSLGHEYRRILLLEVLADAVVKMESFQTREEFASFAAEMKATRERSWGPRPWPRVKDSDVYLRDVADLARIFAESDGSADYASRGIGP